MPIRLFGSPLQRAVVCEVCGALIVKQNKHRKWHKRQPASAKRDG